MSEWAAKRFWSEARFVEVEGGYGVHLDDRPVRTPTKAPLVVPTEAMAQAIVIEWDAQNDKIDPLSMPVTRSANAAIDKVRTQKDEVVDMIAAYGDSDLICYRADGPDALVHRQSEAWDPLIEWAGSAFNARLQRRVGVIHKPQDAAALSALHSQVAQLDPFALTAFHDLVSLSGSLVIGFAVTHDHLPAPVLWDISRIDENWQEELWGRDEEAAALADVKRAAFLHADRFYRLNV